MMPLSLRTANILTAFRNRHTADARADCKSPRSRWPNSIVIVDWT
jgi:hypothetical protein